MRAKSIKFLEENIGVNLYDLAFGNEFLDMTIKHEQQKKKTNLASSKLKLLCIRSFLDIIKKVKRQLTEEEKLLANQISGKGLVSKIYKEFL